jgi:DNA-binding GntR family transcriptional regulator
MRVMILSKKEEIFEILKEQIVTGAIRPGTWLTERELVDLYGISRTPIREILWKLSNLRIIEATSDRGYRVKSFSITDIIDIYNARKAVEGECARLACLSKDCDYEQRVQSLIKALKEADAEKDSVHCVEIGVKIHDFILEKADNEYLRNFSDSIKSVVAVMRNSTKTHASIEKKSKNDHMLILEALQARDEIRCAQAMREHLHSTCIEIVRDDCNSLLGLRANNIFGEGEKK